MDGTFGGGDLISASLAIMLGGTDAELHEKSVFFSLAMITASETGIFEYDPQDEPPSGRPPGPWDGYNFFTVDLSTVKDNIEDMLARIAELEDELEDCHGCWEDVVAKLQEYDPDYDPDEGECPTEEIGKVVDEKEQEIEALEEQIEECNQCKADVIAKLQEYDPNFDPQTCSDIPPEIDEIAGYRFDPDPDNPDPDRYDKIAELVDSDNLTDNDLHIIVKPMDTDAPNPDRHNVFYGFYNSVDGSIIGMSQTWQSPRQGDYVGGFKMVDPTTGTYEFYYCYPDYWSPTGWTKIYYTETNQNLIGYGDPTHSYTATNKKNS